MNASTTTPEMKLAVLKDGANIYSGMGLDEFEITEMAAGNSKTLSSDIRKSCEKLEMKLKENFRSDTKTETNAQIARLAKLGYDVTGICNWVNGERYALAVAAEKRARDEYYKLNNLSGTTPDDPRFATSGVNVYSSGQSTAPSFGSVDAADCWHRAMAQQEKENAQYQAYQQGVEKAYTSGNVVDGDVQSSSSNSKNDEYPLTYTMDPEYNIPMPIADEYIRSEGLTVNAGEEYTSMGSSLGLLNTINYIVGVSDTTFTVKETGERISAQYDTMTQPVGIGVTNQLVGISVGNGVYETSIESGTDVQVIPEKFDGPFETKGLEVGYGFASIQGNVLIKNSWKGFTYGVGAGFNMLETGTNINIAYNHITTDYTLRKDSIKTLPNQQYMSKDSISEAQIELAVQAQYFNYRNDTPIDKYHYLGQIQALNDSCNNYKKAEYIHKAQEIRRKIELNRRRKK